MRSESKISQNDLSLINNRDRDKKTELIQNTYTNNSNDLKN